jgi:hypothetical protein
LVTPKSPTVHTIEEARTQILSSSSRNGLINLRDRGEQGIAIVETDPGALYERLLNSPKGIPWRSAADSLPVDALAMVHEALNDVSENIPLVASAAYLPGAQSELGDAQMESDFPYDGTLEPRSSEYELATAGDTYSQSGPRGKEGPAAIVAPYTEANLRHRLDRTVKRARQERDEKGIHSLHLVLGVLTWSDEKGTKMRSPLVVVPVHIDREGRGDYCLRLADIPVERNEALAAKLKQEFGLDLPSIDPTGPFDYSSYVAAVAKVAARDPRVSLDCSICLVAPLSFEGMLLYGDLDSNRWPAGRKPEDNPLVQQIFAGTPSPVSTVGSEPIKSMCTQQLVVEADASQIEAISRAANGENVVIQGPPGTGKSQTITNILASLLARGKRVLLISEKAAALEVIKSNLESIGMGHVMLDLHAADVSRSSVMKSIRDAKNRDVPAEVDYDAIRIRVRELESKIHRHQRAVSRVIPTRGISFHDAVGEQARIWTSAERSGPRLLDLTATGLQNLSADPYQKILGLCERIEQILQEGQDLARHPLFESILVAHPLPQEGSRIQAALATGLTQMRTAKANIDTLLQKSGLPETCSVTEVRQVLDVIRYVRDNEKAVFSAKVADSEGGRGAAHLAQQKSVLEMLRQISEIRDAWRGVLREEAWGCSHVEELRRGLARIMEQDAPRWKHALSPKYWKVWSSVRALYIKGSVPSLGAWSKALEDISKVQQLRAQLESPEMLKIFGESVWRGADTDPQILCSVVHFSEAFATRFANSPYLPQVLKSLEGASDRSPVYELLDTTNEALTTAQRVLEQCVERVGLDPTLEIAAMNAVSLDAWCGRIEELGLGFATVGTIIELNALCEELSEQGMLVSKGVLREWAEAKPALLASVRWTWLSKVIEEHVATHPELQRPGTDHPKNLVRDYHRAVADLFHATTQRLECQVWSRMPTAMNSGQAGFLGSELSKRSRHCSIRTLMMESGSAVQAIKPVFCASPESVARFLPPDAPVEFDTVIIDEASQMAPLDALGLVARARQIIVVGDRNQMPPARGFEPSSIDVAAGKRGVLLDESILAAAERSGIPRVMLDKHRRSMDPSLISLASELHYLNKLQAFPSPRIGVESEGLTYRKIDNAVYDRGGAATNQKEADAVVDAVMQHTRDFPGRSLGVVAFNQEQAKLIARGVDDRLATDPEARKVLFENHSSRTFFVRSLENVQGDERDSIFVSIGYGLDHQGKFSYQFGPLGVAGGERRLNVLMTRARWECRLFSSIEPEQLGGEERPVGVQHLRRYLEKARSRMPGGVAHPGDTLKETSEQTLMREALESEGYVVERNVGQNGVTIDLAVRDSSDPTRYALGIIFDGTNSSEDGLRAERLTWMPAELEQRGWSIATVWTCDLLTRRGEVVESIKKMLRAPESRPSPLVGCITRRRGVVRSSVEVLDGQSRLTAYREARITWPRAIRLDNATPAVVARLLCEVVAVESPVHREEVQFRLLAGAHLTSEAERRFNDGLRHALNSGQIQRDGEFLVARGQSAEVGVRKRVFMRERTLDWICHEELLGAIDLVVKNACAIKQSDVPSQVLAVLGIADSRSVARARILRELDAYHHLPGDWFTLPRARARGSDESHRQSRG